jgi:hypothetical protein
VIKQLSTENTAVKIKKIDDALKQLSTEEPGVKSNDKGLPNFKD